jgi:hypothetical protein
VLVQKLAVDINLTELVHQDQQLYAAIEFMRQEALE